MTSFVIDDVGKKVVNTGVGLVTYYIILASIKGRGGGDDEKETLAKANYITKADRFIIFYAFLGLLTVWQLMFHNIFWKYHNCKNVSLITYDSKYSIDDKKTHENVVPWLKEECIINFQ